MAYSTAILVTAKKRARGIDMVRSDRLNIVRRWEVKFVLVDEGSLQYYPATKKTRYSKREDIIEAVINAIEVDIIPQIADEFERLQVTRITHVNQGK